jgi:thioredoxin 1
MCRWAVTPLVFAGHVFVLVFLFSGCENQPPAGSIVKADKDNFRTIVVNSNRPVLVEFWSDSCEPCKQLEPHLVALAQKHHELLVAKVNAEENVGLMEHLGVRMLPTLLVYQDGEVKRRKVGAPKPAELTELVSAYVSAK